MRKPNRNDVARYAQVSGATVSRVLSGRDDVAISVETRQRVLSAAEGLGYRLNHSARALVTGRTDLVALWMDHITTPFHARVANLLAIANRPSAYRILITDTSGLMGEGIHVDGIIAHEGMAKVRAFLHSSNATRPPIVTVGAEVVESLDYVAVDLYAGQIEAIHHLYNVGCRSIALLINAGSNKPEDARAQGYRDAMRDLELPTEYIETVDADQSRAGSWQAVHQYLERRAHARGSHAFPDGIVCLNDEMAIGANRALRERGLRVPEDICLIGCDGIEDTEYQTPPLSTVVQPLSEMARLAWQFLQVRMEDPNAPRQQIILKPSLMIRASSQR